MNPDRKDVQLAQCLSRVRQSEPEAARLLVERLYPLVIRIVRSHRPVRTAEEDLAQEVFAKLFARLDQYQERSDVPFEHWVSRLAVRTCLDALRAERNCAGAIFPRNHRRGLEFMLTDESAPPSAGPDSVRELLERLLSQLPPDGSAGPKR